MSTTALAGPIALIGPHPPFRGGIAHFTERVDRAFTDSGAIVLPISFSRLYPGLLFPGRSQTEEVQTGMRPAEQTIDSINPVSWAHTSRRILDSKARFAIFMYWMPFFVPAYYTIARKLRRSGVHILSVAHNAVPHERHVGDRFLARKFFRSCETVFVLSRSVENDVRSLAPNVRLSYRPHPIYDQFGGAVSREVARKELGIADDRKVLLFFGMVRKYKGLNVLLKALPTLLETMPELLLVIAGEFYDDISETRKMIQDLALESHVRIEDRYIPTKDVRTFFSATDVVVQPYLSATQSGVIQTAFQFGTPVIVSDVGGLAESVGSAGMAVPKNDPEALTEAIRRYFMDNLKSVFTAEMDQLRASSTWSQYVAVMIEEMNALENNKRIVL